MHRSACFALPDIDMSRFTYEPLPDSTTQIRLLDLLPGRGWSRIRCRLRAVDLASAKGSYEPLSYCWGSQRMRREILVNGMHALIGRNLDDELQCMRRKEEVRTLWVDALCINQRDVQEKNAQIPLMTRIFENGARTVVWLGRERLSTASAFRVVESLAHFAEEHPGHRIDPWDCKKYRRHGHTKELGPLERLFEAPRQGQVGRALERLFDRAWFKRVWVIQEVAVSERLTVHCGKYETSWDKIEKAYYISTEGLDIDGTLSHLIEQRAAYRSSEAASSLPSIIWLGSLARATDTRDKIYAMLGLVQPGADCVPVTVDYNIRPAEVFETFTRQYLETYRDLGILACSIGCRDQEGLGPMPSWTWRPLSGDTDLRGDELFAWSPVADPLGRFQASGSSSYLPLFKEDGKLLGVQGYEIDIVTEAGGVIQDSKSRYASGVDSLLVSDVVTYLSWRRIAGVDDGGSYRDSEEPVANAFRHVICPDAIVDSSEEDQDAMEQFETFILENFGFLRSVPSPFRRLCGIIKSFQLNYARAFGSNALSVLDSLYDVMPLPRRRLVKTASGYFGLAPRHTKIGDLAVLLAGSRAPFILRKSGQRYMIVGDCYLHGVMSGELWDITKSKSIWIE